MKKTDIAWCDFTANPLKYRRKSDGKVVWGCTKCSPGSANCYSEAIGMRFNRGSTFNARNMEELELFLDDLEMRKMLTAKTIGGIAVSGSRCFIGDMTDVFGEWVSDELLNRLFSSVLEIRNDVTWQILTKRAERMQNYLSWRWGEGRIPARNIHVGVSVENQQLAEERLPLLSRTPAAVRFLSAEPLVGPLGELHLDGIHQVIVGGESGPHHRPFEVEWAESIYQQCRAKGVAFFMKQDMGPRPGMQGRIPDWLWNVKEFAEQ